jgi:hypothetical protein
MRHVEGYFHILRINFKSQYTHTPKDTHTHTLLNKTHTHTHTHIYKDTHTHLCTQTTTRLPLQQNSKNDRLCLYAGSNHSWYRGSHTNTHKSKDTHTLSLSHTHTHTEALVCQRRFLLPSKQTNIVSGLYASTQKKEGIPKNHFKVSHTNQPIVR